MSAVALLALLTAACSSDASAAPGKVTFNLTGVEWKGSTNGIAAPAVDPTTKSAGYRYKAPGAFDPNDAKKWEVATYAWTPGAMTVSQGEEVTLRLFAVNGDKHEAILYAPDGSTVATDTYQRGQEGKLSFTASQAGHYRLLCVTHGPTMEAIVTSIGR